MTFWRVTHKSLCESWHLGYNGAYGEVGSGMTATMEARKEFYGDTRPDGNNWTLPENVHPYRFYLGVKGLMEDGSKAKDSDFLARNGLRYGQIVRILLLN